RSLLGPNRRAPNPLVEHTVQLRSRFTPGAPKRFAQLIGLLFAAVSMVLAFLEQYVAMGVIGACLFGASFLQGFGNFCIACRVFG
ncbi:unnamed protein product, partial [Ectocarpus fasciculatus]